jgi:hypothetical protein
MRYVTFYFDVLRQHASDLEIHADKETALKFFNKNCKKYFSVNTGWKACKLPASYGYPMRKFIGMSASAFRKKFGITIDEAKALQSRKG